jgi:transcriptional regulator GlxA family with amidase domain
MFKADAGRVPQEVVILMVPNFSMMAFTSVIEPLRMANRVAERGLYEWKTVAVEEDARVYASNGVPILPDSAIDSIDQADLVLVCAGVAVESFRDKRVEAWLRKLASRGVPLGGVCTGSLILARAGLLSGYRCTIHWENVEGFVEEFPELDITSTLYEVDRDRCSCSGGIAPLDMMLHLIALDHGRDLAITVAEHMLHSGVRHPHEPQRMSLAYRTGINDPKVLAAMAHMEAFIETPVSLEDLAAAAGVSTRQLERLFRIHVGKTPTRYYQELRLKRARLLLTQTSMPILQIAVSCGFTSASHFGKCYRALFMHTPREDRERWAKERLRVA